MTGRGDGARGRRWADHRRTLEAIAWKHLALWSQPSTRNSGSTGSRCGAGRRPGRGATPPSRAPEHGVPRRGDRSDRRRPGRNASPTSEHRLVQLWLQPHLGHAHTLRRPERLDHHPQVGAGDLESEVVAVRLAQVDPCPREVSGVRDPVDPRRLGSPVPSAWRAAPRSCRSRRPARTRRGCAPRALRRRTARQRSTASPRPERAGWSRCPRTRTRARTRHRRRHRRRAPPGCVVRDAGRQLDEPRLRIAVGGGSGVLSAEPAQDDTAEGRSARGHRGRSGLVGRSSGPAARRRPRQRHQGSGGPDPVVGVRCGRTCSERDGDAALAPSRRRRLPAPGTGRRAG